MSFIKFKLVSRKTNSKKIIMMVSPLILSCFIMKTSGGINGEREGGGMRIFLYRLINENVNNARNVKITPHKENCPFTYIMCILHILCRINYFAIIARQLCYYTKQINKST